MIGSCFFQEKKKEVEREDEVELQGGVGGEDRINKQRISNMVFGSVTFDQFVEPGGSMGFAHLAGFGASMLFLPFQTLQFFLQRLSPTMPRP